MSYVCPVNVLSKVPELGFHILIVLSGEREPDAKFPFGNVANVLTILLWPINVKSNDPKAGFDVDVVNVFIDVVDTVVLVVDVVLVIEILLVVDKVLKIIEDTIKIHFPGEFTFDFNATFVILLVNESGYE